jgi:hypothetical protein
MSETIEQNWDYCQIDYLLLDGGQEFSEMNAAGRKAMWFQFRARADGPNGRYIAGEAEKMPLANMIGSDAFAPQRNNGGHSNTLQILIEKLQKEGWELVKDQGSGWWEKRLRRPSDARPSFTKKLRNFFKAA